MQNVTTGLVRPARPAKVSESGYDTPGQRAENWPLPGFGWNTRITTSFGDLPIQGLRLRDPVRTSHGNYLQVKWIDQIHLDEDFLLSCPDAQPIIIHAHSFGPGRPAATISLSPAQRLNVAPGQFGQDIRRARDIDSRHGVQRGTETTLSYYLFHCGEPAQVMVEGMAIPVAP